MKNRILRGFRALIVTLIVVVAMAAPTLISGSASAQTVVVRVDGIGGSTSPAGQGNGWGSTPICTCRMD